MSQPVTVHAGFFVQSRLPVVLHRIIPANTLSMQGIATLEAAIISNLLYMYVIRMSYAPMEMMEYIAAGAVGAGVYMALPP